MYTWSCHVYNMTARCTCCSDSLLRQEDSFASVHKNSSRSCSHNRTARGTTWELFAAQARAYSTHAARIVLRRQHLFGRHSTRIMPRHRSENLSKHLPPKFSDCSTNEETYSTSPISCPFNSHVFRLEQTKIDETFNAAVLI